MAQPLQSSPRASAAWARPAVAVGDFIVLTGETFAAMLRPPYAWRELIEQILNRGLAEFGVLRVLPENIAAQPALVGTAPSLLVRSQEFGHARNLGRWRMPWELIEERVRQNPPPARLYDDVMKDLQDGWAYGMRETPRP